MKKLTPVAELLAAYDDAVMELVADEETGYDKDGCRAVYRRRIRRIRALIARRLEMQTADVQELDAWRDLFARWLQQINDLMVTPLPVPELRNPEWPQDVAILAASLRASLKNRKPAPRQVLGREAEPMTYNEFTPDGGWKLHDCPDGKPCRADIGGGCARGWCAHFEVKPDGDGVPRYPAKD